MNQVRDAIVIGGGHAGCEAASAIARMGGRVALVTFEADKLGAMSCNPAIGGLGKGHLVREVDAFDGLIGRAADAAAIHYRMLNRSKGSAVHGPRVQADRRLFRAAVQAMLARAPGLEVIEGEAVALMLEQGRCCGVRLGSGVELRARAVIVCTGTFLGGRLFLGEERREGGRIAERAATRLGQQFGALGLPMARLKTGTPPRLDGRTIDWARLDTQASDEEAWTMSPLTRERCNPQLFCAITRTNPWVHEIIASNLHRSPLFTGAIGAAGPRYCPSIEDKIHRFAGRDGHQIFLEPEGLDTPLVYPNGISTSLPAEVQAALVRQIEGLERAVIVQPGYAVEYDHVDPRALGPDLQARDLPGLYCAGQINGTTGYEEAAAQGLVAGIHAGCAALDRAPPALDRANCYLAVMVDDLVLHGVSEPYRMLTARAEYRLRLRANNATTRLTGIAQELGCLGAERSAWFAERSARREEWQQELAREISAAQLQRAGLPARLDTGRKSIAAWLAHEGLRLADFGPWLPDGFEVGSALAQELEEDAVYAPYLARQEAELRDLRSSEQVALGDGFPYPEVPGLSHEMVERLARAAPQTLAAAGRVPGITPAALAALLVHSRRRQGQAA